MNSITQTSRLIKQKTKKNSPSGSSPRSSGSVEVHPETREKEDQGVHSVGDKNLRSTERNGCSGSQIACKDIKTAQRTYNDLCRGENHNPRADLGIAENYLEVLHRQGGGTAEIVEGLEKIVDVLGCDKGVLLSSLEKIIDFYEKYRYKLKSFWDVGKIDDEAEKIKKRKKKKKFYASKFLIEHLGFFSIVDSKTGLAVLKSMMLGFETGDEKWFDRAGSVSICCRTAVKVECSEDSDHVFFKKVPCRQDICPVCSQRDSIGHRQRVQRVNDNLAGFEKLGQFIFTIPEQLREKCLEKKRVRSLRTAAYNVVKGVERNGEKIFKYGFATFEPFGDRDKTVFKPHFPVVAVALKDVEMEFSKEALGLLRKRWRKGVMGVFSDDPEAIGIIKKADFNDKELNFNYKYVDKTVPDIDIDGRDKNESKWHHRLKYNTKTVFDSECFLKLDIDFLSENSSVLFYNNLVYWGKKPDEYIVINSMGKRFAWVSSRGVDFVCKENEGAKCFLSGCSGDLKVVWYSEDSFSVSVGELQKRSGIVDIPGGKYKGVLTYRHLALELAEGFPDGY